MRGEHETLAQLRQTLLGQWGEHYECIFSDAHLLELTGKNVHKGSGVLAAAALLGVRAEHIYCVGDNDNDVPMLRVARIGFAPAGSVAAGRDVPGLCVARDADHGCLEDVIGQLEMIYR